MKMKRILKFMVVAAAVLVSSLAYAQFGDGPTPYTVTLKEVNKGAEDKVTLDVTFDLPGGIHVYTTKDQFFDFNVSKSIGLGKPVVTLPKLKEYTDPLGHTSKVLTGKQIIKVTLPYTGNPGSEWSLEGTMGSQGCDDATCYAPQDDIFKLNGIIPKGAVVTINTKQAEAKPAREHKKQESADIDNLGFVYEINGGDSANGSGASIGLIIKYMIFAFIGGLILNFMPCVLPVLSIKALSIVNSAHHDRKEIFKGAMAYTAGILVSFIVLATLIIIAKSTGKNAAWGDHMQNPTFVIILFIMIWVFSLSLLDVFIIQVPGIQTASQAGSHGGHKGSFLSGVFAVLVSTPCTAPMLGSAVGFMFAQPAYLVMISFILIGIGLAFPFILLGLTPNAMKFIPRPGAWMNTFKELMAFLLLGTGVFLLTILHSLLSEHFLMFCVFILPLSFACWIYGKYAGPVNTVAQQWIFSFIALAMVIGSAILLIDIPEQMPDDVRDKQIGGWCRVSDELVAKARNEGRLLLVDYNSVWSQDKGSVELNDELKNFLEEHDAIIARDESVWKPLNADRLRKALVDEERMVFIDFGAEWCASCKFNERTVLFTESMQKEFKKRKVLLLKGDFTKENPEIHKWLKKFGRAGVPLYVLFKPGKRIEARTLPEVITAGMVLDALDKE